jgi:hypothetical protein
MDGTLSQVAVARHNVGTAVQLSPKRGMEDRKGGRMEGWMARKARRSGAPERWDDSMAFVLTELLLGGMD